MSGRTARMLGAMTAAAASGLAMTCGAAQASGERFVNPPRGASINSSSDIPIEVDPATFRALSAAVATGWRITIDGDTLATPGMRDGVDSIGFSAVLPQNVLGAYVYWPRRVYKMQTRCTRRLGKRRVCRHVKRYLHTEITEADVVFSTAFYWN